MRKLSIFTTFALALPSLVATLDSKTIITEWTGVFYTVNLAHFADWPNLDGSIPMDVSAVANRIWLIWPHTVINLSAGGMLDTKSLLSLFSSQTANWNEGRWSPENGILSSKGDWLGYLEDRFYRLDLLSAKVWSTDWKGGPVESLLAAPDGNLIAFIDAKAYYVNLSNHKHILVSALDFNVPPILAVSTQEPELAWLDKKEIHLVSLKDGSEEIIPLAAGALPSGNPWGASWFGGSLVLAYPSTLCAVDLSLERPPRISKFEAGWLPRRWYRLRGGGSLLLVHSPENEKLRIYGAEEPTAPLPSYKDFLAEHAIPAGRLLEEKEEFEAAVQYYNWTLPQIRDFRSKYPLEKVWAELEHELVERRSVLLQID